MISKKIEIQIFRTLFKIFILNLGVPLALRAVPPYREVAQQSFVDFATLSHKGSAAFAPPNIGGVSEGRGGFAPPNIGGVSEGRGGFAALRIPHA